MSLFSLKYDKSKRWHVAIIAGNAGALHMYAFDLLEQSISWPPITIGFARFGSLAITCFVVVWILSLIFPPKLDTNSIPEDFK